MANRTDSKVAFFAALNRVDTDFWGVEEKSCAAYLLKGRESQNFETFPTTRSSKPRRPGAAVRCTTPLVKCSQMLPSCNKKAVDVLNSEASHSFTDDGTPKLSKIQADVETLSLPAMETSIRTTTAKRKRVTPLQIIPEPRQIFRGLAFYFIPNDDIAPARRMRITKAREYGAIWARNLRDGVTHVIADRGLHYQDIIKFLELSSLPPHIVLVNELYPAECLQFQFVVDPTQPQYQVKGSEQALLAQDNTSGDKDSDEKSLQLKPAKKDSIKSLMTTSRSGDTTDNAPSPRDLVSDSVSSKSERSQSSLLGVGPKKQKDALDEAIKEAEAFKDVPLNPDEEELQQQEVTSDCDSDSLKDPRRKKLKNKYALGISKGSGFACMQPPPSLSSSQNPNTPTIAILQQMADYHSRLADLWRPRAYRKAIATLRCQSCHITSASDALNLPNVGPSLALKIEEIATTHRLRHLDEAQFETQDHLLQKFMSIYGVGPSQAARWIADGHTSLDDLLAKAYLTPNQRTGIAHYDDFLTRIPRAKVQALGTVVQQAAHEIDPLLEIHIMGSYRRGATSSGDIDVLITKPEAEMVYLRHILLDKLLPILFQLGFLQASLASMDPSTGTTWHGACTVPPSSSFTSQKSQIWHRIDILLVPTSELGAAMIYFTGDDIFNRSIRLLASKRGMRLNQRGLWKDILRGPARQRVTQGTLVEGRSEKRIFEVLGVPWRDPTDRIFLDFKETCDAMQYKREDL
ncbi:MAG: hypothetical protein M1837_004351 [Sclerophora amabilis]|nr:MAG: hypothetical protein M1837_004351 [Sclerophora amabilis]